jgi:hypothetical protein
VGVVLSIERGERKVEDSYRLNFPCRSGSTGSDAKISPPMREVLASPGAIFAVLVLADGKRDAAFGGSMLRRIELKLSPQPSFTPQVRPPPGMREGRSFWALRGRSKLFIG